MSLIESPDSPLVSRVHASPNVEPRAGGMTPSILLLHYTGMTCCEKAIDWLSRPESKVSCHYVIDEAGAITQMVAENKRAWHAGRSIWAGETDVNSASIGIEIHNPGHDDGYPDFPAAQMQAVMELSRDIVQRNSIEPRHVLAHSDVAPGRKIDPGEKFDWAWLAANGVGHWVEPAGVGPLIGAVSHLQNTDDIARAQRLLGQYGYGIEVSGRNDKASRTIVSAFQRHFRPARFDGLIDASTVATVEALLDALKLRSGVS